nr:uncharacterized protein LOC107445556 isoform X2 [Parasteatoda tepidariorum]
MKNFIAVICMVFANICTLLQSTVGLENGAFNEGIADFIDENTSGEAAVPFLLPESLDEVKNINVLQKIRDSDLGTVLDANEDGSNYEVITQAQLLFKEVVDRGEDEVKVAGAAMDLFEEIKEIPKEIHDSFKDSAKNVWNKAKKVSGHVLKIPNQVSDMWKKSSVTTEESGSKGGLFRFPRLG